MKWLPSVENWNKFLKPLRLVVLTAENPYRFLLYRPGKIVPFQSYLMEDQPETPAFLRRAFGMPLGKSILDPETPAFYRKRMGIKLPHA